MEKLTPRQFRFLQKVQVIKQLKFIAETNINKLEEQVNDWFYMNRELEIIGYQAMSHALSNGESRYFVSIEYMEVFTDEDYI